MKKYIIILVLFSMCNVKTADSPGYSVTTTSSTTTSTTKDTTTTTVKKATSSGCFLSTAVQLKVAIYDDSISTPYDSVVFYTIQTSTGVEKWEKISPDLSYGSDSFDLVCKDKESDSSMLLLAFDKPNIELPSAGSIENQGWNIICYSPTNGDIGDLATIWVVLNDNNIEVDGLSVRDIVIDRKTRTKTLLSDNSYPKDDCGE